MIVDIDFYGFSKFIDINEQLIMFLHSIFVVKLWIDFDLFFCFKPWIFCENGSNCPFDMDNSFLNFLNVLFHFLDIFLALLFFASHIF
jgi:hypothetical protein